jgi:hypothetical protein
MEEEWKVGTEKERFGKKGEGKRWERKGKGWRKRGRRRFDRKGKGRVRDEKGKRILVKGVDCSLEKKVGWRKVRS